MLIPRRSAASQGVTGSDRGEASIGRAAVRGAVIGYFAVVTLIGSILLIAGADWVVALAAGAFVGVWGGPGWGGMIAAQIHADRLAEEEREASKAGQSF